MRLRAGRRRKAEHGGFAYGSPRYGYQSVDGELIPDPNELIVLKRVRALSSEGQAFVRSLGV